MLFVSFINLSDIYLILYVQAFGKESIITFQNFSIFCDLMFLS